MQTITNNANINLPKSVQIINKVIVDTEPLVGHYYKTYDPNTKLSRLHVLTNETLTEDAFKTRQSWVCLY